MRNKSFIYTLVIVLVLGAGAYFWLSQYSTSENMVGDNQEKENMDMWNWETYRNEELGFEIDLPENTEVTGEVLTGQQRGADFMSNDIQFSVRLKEWDVPLEEYFYFDLIPSSTTTINGEKALIFKAPNGYCDGPSCTPPFIAYSVKKDSTFYNLVFSGKVDLSDLEKAIVSSFRIIN